MKDFSASTALIVEDSAVQREHVAALLRQIGFGTVLIANDGINACARWSSAPPRWTWC